MKKSLYFLLSITFTLTLIACTTTPTQIEDKRIHVTILHFNDIYEITSIGGGKEGGITRLATLRKQLLARNPNTITTLSGDLFSPSAIGTVQYEGDSLAGRQMVDVLNHLGLDFATFGNHEFDLNENQFRQRLKEAKFTWVSSNVFDNNGKPYDGVEQNIVIPITDQKSGETFNIGLFGLTIAVNKPGYVLYTDPITTAKIQVEQLVDQTNLIVALTHQTIDEDVMLLQTYPQIGLLLGGHEHNNFQRWRGNYVPLLKGDANARSVYVVDLYFDPTTGITDIKPTFVPINDSLAEDVPLKTVVDQWINIAFEAFGQEGFEAERVVTTTTETLDGLESNVRSRQTNLTALIANSMLAPYPEAELSIYNSGAIRIDDIIPAGEITVYDIIRVLPFGGKVQLATIKGDLLIKTLNQGLENKGSGGFLHSAKTQQRSGIWYIKDQPIDGKKTYKLAINDFLASGKEYGLEFLKPDHPDFVIINQGEAYDIRQQVIKALTK